MRRLITPAEFAGQHVFAQPEGIAAEGIALWRAVPSDPEATANGRTIRYVLSDGSVARDGHTIATAGWVLDNYRKNPVFLWAHEAGALPLGKIVEIGAVGDRLCGTVEYADYDFADLVYRLAKGGYLNATSVSWLPIEWKFSADKARVGGIDFLRQELLEVSQVPVPALPTALADARSAGIDTGPLYAWAGRLLDSGDQMLVSRTELEQLRRAAKMPATPKTRGAPKRLVRDLYDVGWLAQLVLSLACLKDCVEWEAVYEEDGSPIPGQIKDVLAVLGQILIDMTAEEVAELLAEGAAERSIEGSDAQRLVRAIAKLVRGAPQTETRRDPHVVSVRLDPGQIEALVRAGRVLSADNERCLRDAHDHLTRGCDMVRGLLDLVDEAEAEEPDDPDIEARGLRTRRARALRAQLDTVPAR